MKRKGTTGFLENPVVPFYALCIIITKESRLTHDPHAKIPVVLDLSAENC